MKPPFPSVIDSTMISLWRACPAKLYMSQFEHWKSRQESVHLVAGGAFAHGLEHARRAFYLDHLPADEAAAIGIRELWKHYGEFEEPEDSPKSALRMAGALEFYFSAYPLGSDGATPHVFGAQSHGIEFSFVEPLSVRHPTTGDPVLFSGRADMVCDSFGGLFLYDEKTTGQLGATWAKKWDQRSQFTAYCWGLRGHGIKPTGVVVRGVAIYKDGYDTQQAITYRSDWEVDRWEEQVNREVGQMITAWESGVWDYNLDDSCIAYGGCGFQRICKTPPADRDRWFSLYYERRAWNPVTRTETKLEEA